jgi:hypothetical protein
MAWDYDKVTRCWKESAIAKVNLFGEGRAGADVERLLSSNI